MGGLAAAVTAADEGCDVVLIEKNERLGGAAAYSGGQVWIGINHVAQREGCEPDTYEEVLEYIRTLAEVDPKAFDEALADEWIRGASEAAEYFETSGVITWTVIPDYPDYYFPTVSGSKSSGRYITGAPFQGSLLGEARDLLHNAPHFPSGITYGEMFAWGGIVSKTAWDHQLMAQRKVDDVMTFGQGITGHFLAGVVKRGVQIMSGTAVTELIVNADCNVEGVVAIDRTGARIELHGPVILATGAHDWDLREERWNEIPEGSGGSVAPNTLSGDGLALVEPTGAATRAIPAWAAPVLPGYLTSLHAFDGDTGFRGCYEHCMPHSIIVNRFGERFCDDSFHPSIVRKGLEGDGGNRRNVPMYMVWDDNHHHRYGLGITPPGEIYPDDVVTSAPTLRELAVKLNIDPDGFEATVVRFNEEAAHGKDPEFGRGQNYSVRRFRGDGNHPISPNVAPLDCAPFHGLNLRLLNTGIASKGIVTAMAGRVKRADGTIVDGVYAVGELATRLAAGMGYNSGYSLSRAMTYGRLSVLDAVLREPELVNRKIPTS
jgi:3-oxosteroid 1-dehydrogenase